MIPATAYLDVVAWLAAYLVLVLGFARAAHCSSQHYRDELEQKRLNARQVGAHERQRGC